MRIEYMTPCPECAKIEQNATIAFDSDTGEIACNGENHHVFESMPGEPAPIAEATEPESTSNFGKADNGSEPEMTTEEIAALDAAMQEAPKRRDFGHMVGDAVEEVTTEEIVDPEPAIEHGEAVSGDFQLASDAEGLIPRQVTDWSQCCVCRPGDAEGHYCDAHVPTAIAPIGYSPRVGLGEFVVLPNGDAICGVRITETWVSALQAEGENQSPPKNMAEYLQEIIDLGLVEWHVAAPVAR
jgi:hypothetical protein